MCGKILEFLVTSLLLLGHTRIYAEAQVKGKVNDGGPPVSTVCDTDL